jgi:alpha-beta hydrolase superfamily lysophospholipase
LPQLPKLKILQSIAAILAIVAIEVESSQRVTFRTDDGVTLAATWYEPASRPAPAVILVHMLHRSRRDWDGVAQRFSSEGFGALALDLRGHGESGGRTAGDGAEADYSSMVLDVKAARRYLAMRGDVAQTRVAIVGASIGANLAVLEASADPTVASLALLSPSLEYRGLRIEALLRKLSRPVLLVASDDDPYASRSVRDLQKAGGGQREVVTVRQAGHGTTMLTRDPDLVRTLVDWLRRTLL